MKLAIVTCLWRRPALTKTVLKYYARTFPDCILIAVKDPNDAQIKVDGWEFIEHPNEPLPQKFNAAFLEAQKYNPDAVVLVGSDDLLSRQLIDFYQSNYGGSRNYILGLKDLYFHNNRTGETIHWHGLQGKDEGMPIGCGRIFSKTVLNKLDWKPYGDLEVKRGLDTNSTIYMKSKGVGQSCITMAESGIAVDLKGDQSINPFDEWKFNFSPSEISIIESEFPEEMASIHGARMDESRFPKGKTITCKIIKSELEGEFIGEIGSNIILEGSTAFGMYRNGLIALPEIYIDIPVEPVIEITDEQFEKAGYKKRKNTKPQSEDIT